MVDVILRKGTQLVCHIQRDKDFTYECIFPTGEKESVDIITVWGADFVDIGNINNNTIRINPRVDVMCSVDPRDDRGFKGEILCNKPI